MEAAGSNPVRTAVKKARISRRCGPSRVSRHASSIRAAPRSGPGAPSPALHAVLTGPAAPRYSGKQGPTPRGPWRWHRAASAGHETRALLRAHLSAASSYGHLMRHRPVCHRLLRPAPAAPPHPSQPAAEQPAPNGRSL
ncbi:DUF6274 family protein [Streptomyces griseoflavus]|uniref:DUF6274 family protein n=1 Tax=Streptomyces griseoflavus TaxID=35619 RepID=UPI003803E239